MKARRPFASSPSLLPGTVKTRVSFTTWERPLSYASRESAAFHKTWSAEMADGNPGSQCSTVSPGDPERKIVHRGTPRKRLRSRAVSASTASMSKSPRRDEPIRVKSARRVDWAIARICARWVAVTSEKM